MTYKIPQYQPHFVYDKASFDELEQQLDELNAELNVREIEVTFTGKRLFFGNVTTSRDAYQFIRDTILKGIEVQEHLLRYISIKPTRLSATIITQPAQSTQHRWILKSWLP